MKIEGKKDIAAERLRGRAAVDAVYVPRINAAMGPKFALYIVKGMDSSRFGGEDEALEIEKNYRTMIDRLATIESERQALQARIDAATTAAEIDAIIASI
ncbi:hypothetical protein [Phyllobacterium chamaecytisi]|uniref:hypothetical protein n=1 Tax=Phyllobacterium chamaecytisi TaxID=2876082 RepID=UPI001CCF3A26|nr:hypothetical protein [Phyllobacterium sp. KW56]MBZ9600767.1 hypothetical protein [Phyllobacterium sp. KW56]